MTDTTEVTAAGRSDPHVATVPGRASPVARHAGSDQLGSDLLELRGLHVRYGDGPPVLDEVDLDVRRGELVAVLGASGSGKTTLLRVLMGLVPRPGRVEAAAHRLVTDGGVADLARADVRVWTEVRTRYLGVVYQDASQALTPLRRVGSLLGEVRQLRGVEVLDQRTADEEQLRAVGFDDPEPVRARRGYELSGGMAQRVGVALSVLGDPPLLLADEPTTALDGVARAELLGRLRGYADRGAGVVVVTHDVHVAATIADRAVVLDRGRVVASGDAARVLTHGAGMARASGASVRREVAGSEPSLTPDRGDGTTPALVVDGLTKGFSGTGPVLRGVDVTVPAGQLVGVAGRSGAGKSTLVRCLVGLERADAGDIRIAGQPADDVGWRALRRRVQLVPQDPRGSLNPWRRAWQAVADPLASHRVGDRASRRARAEELLDQVGLGALVDRRPDELSTGQCQRVAIARALAIEPALLVADEPVASLDPELRDEVLRLLRALATETDAAVLMVSHDLVALEATCDRIVVLADGRIADDHAAGAFRAAATHPISRALVRCYPSDPLASLREETT